MLKDFPFDWLKETFKHLHRSSGIYAEEFEDLIDGEHGVQWSDNIPELGRYRQVHNMIDLNPKKIENKISRAKDYGLTADVARKLLLTRVLMHEATHVYSKNSCYGLEIIRKDRPGKLKLTSGFESTSFVRVGKGGGFESEETDSKDLNEGMVDFLAEDIFDKYTEQEGSFSAADRKNFKEFFESFNPYQLQRGVIFDTIYKIAEDADVPPVTAYKGLIQQLFAGGPLKGDLRRWMEKLYGEKVFKKMRDGSFFEEAQNDRE